MKPVSKHTCHSLLLSKANSSLMWGLFSAILLLSTKPAYRQKHLFLVIIFGTDSMEEKRSHECS